MQELSMNILDIAQNSIKAGANLVEIDIREDTAANRLAIRIKDDGCGMDEETVARVTDPFYTSRTTRKVGLGVPFFKMQCELAGGEFEIQSQVGVGTEISGWFQYDHIDRTPIGDMASTYTTLLLSSDEMDFLYTHHYNGEEFAVDTRELKQLLEGVPLHSPEVMAFVKNHIEEQLQQLYGGA